MHRLILLACLPALALAITAQRADAQTCAGSEIRMDLQLPDGDGGFRDPVSTEEAEDFFNRASCTCQTDFAVELHLPNGDASFNESGEVWVGTDCDTAEDQVARNEQCEQVPGGTFEDVVENLRREQKLPINAAAFMWPNDLECGVDKVERGVFLLVDDENTNDTEFLCQQSYKTVIDTQPPPAPPEGSRSLSPGEGSLVASWDPPDERADDIEFYQFLCARTDNSVNDADAFGGDPEYETAFDKCGVDDGSLPMGIDAPPQLQTLSPDALCGTASGTETSHRIEGLENDVPYRVFMLVIDDARNVNVVDLGTATPRPVKDFWEDYKDNGGSAEGGICLISSTYGDDHPFTTAMRDFRDDTLATSALGRWATDLYYSFAMTAGAVIAERPFLRALAQLVLLPLIAIAALWHLLGTPGMLLLLAGLILIRRRRSARPARRLVPAMAGLALVLGLAAPALAQGGGYDPYWEAWEADEPAGPAVPMWNAELKLGPYLPGIDDEFDLGPDEQGPFEEMFRGKTMLLFGVELQRFFWYPEGQLGVTGSIGIGGRSANAFAVDAMGNVIRDADGKAERAPDNKTRFRLMPVSVGAVYRFTALDDRFGVPLVPYGKLGLSYYLWWIRDPNGDFARTQKDPMCDPGTSDCGTTRALGASLGWQASIGLSLRAERLDSDAAVNLRNELGIEHAGFFAELLYADVDGFGASDKLTVGDFTWLAGLSFEF